MSEQKENEQSVDAHEAAELTALLDSVQVAEIKSELFSLLEHFQRFMDQVRDGRIYRAALTNETLKQGARAVGDGFDQALYRKLLEGQPTAAVRTMHDDFAKMATRVNEPE